MRIHSYVVARDFGFAPNPFHGYCTLATCKPVVRRIAEVGDLVIGTSSTAGGKAPRIVYAMRVSERLGFDDYWRDERFRAKRPDLRGTKKQAFGDNIYHHAVGGGGWCQEDSHHSLTTGRRNMANVANDTQTDAVLVAEDYAYWGGEGPEVPIAFRDFEGHDLCAGRGHRNDFPAAMVAAVSAWFDALSDKGFIGEPKDWARSA
jgi:hypothetical protein